MEIRELNKLERCTELMTLVMLASLDMVKGKEQEEYDNSFRWRDRYGTKHKPREMTTNHILYTWLMIWNHSVPSRFTIWFKNRYLFMDHYTNDYMQMAFGALYREIKRRGGYGFKWNQTIEKIERFVIDHPELEEIKIK